VLDKAGRPDDLGLRRLSGLMKGGSIIAETNLEQSTTNPIFLPLNAQRNMCIVCTSDLFQGQLSSAYGGALFTFLLLLKYSSSPFVAPA
jgi:hypothetical protein